MKKGGLLAALILSFAITACGGPAPAPAPAPTPTPKVTPTPTPTPGVTRPWRVVYAASDPRSFMLPGNLVVGVDFGRDVSQEEMSKFKGEAFVVNSGGTEYGSIATMTAGSMTLGREGKTYEFGPTMFFAFEVESRVQEYTFKFQDWPPVDLGNPFSDPIYAP